MFIILGGTGHVGSSVSRRLLEAGEKVTVVTHTPEKAAEWERHGAAVAVADVNDAAALADVFRTGKRLFLLNPPADPAGDAVADEKRSIASIIEALSGSTIEKVVAQSTYGAREGEGIGDLSVLYEMEGKLEATGIPYEIVRAAYYMSNWEMSLATAMDEGVVHTFIPVDFRLPMVSPKDVGGVAARSLLGPAGHPATHHVEGPAHYSPADVAEAFGKALGKPVHASAIPEEKWVPTMMEMGFSERSARSMAAMTRATLDDLERPASPIRGATTLEEYVSELVDRSAE